MSLIKSIMHQLGLSGDPEKNFTLSVPAAPDGTMKLARGNAGATTQDIMTVDAAGGVTYPAAPRTVLFRANKLDGAALPALTLTTLKFNQVVFDTEAGYNALTGGYTIGKDGLYLFIARARILQGPAAGEVSSSIAFTGAGVLDGGIGEIVVSQPASTQVVQAQTNIAWCPAGTVVTSRVYMESAGTLVTSTNPNTTLSVSRIG